MSFWIEAKPYPKLGRSDLSSNGRLLKPRMNKTILLASSSLENKGDALMILAVRQKLGARYRYALPANVAIKSRKALGPYYIYLWCDRPPTTLQRLAFYILVELVRGLCLVFPRILLEKLSIIRQKDIDAVIDVSGYCYGDPWGQALIDHMTRSYSRLKKRKVPIVLLPKTWGPFERISSESIAALIKTSDLVFARDHSSLKELRKHSASRDQNKIHWAPDYTHQVQSVTSGAELVNDDLRIVYIIPSFRVVDSGLFSLREYCSLLDYARAIVVDLGGTPRLLVHETASDMLIIDKLCKLGFERSQVVIEEDALLLKALISFSFGVVTSRLHGLYNALNSGVPPVVIPWNFKYWETLKLYSCEEQLVDTDNSVISLEEAIGRIFCDTERSRLQLNCRQAVQAIQESTEEMWRLVRITSRCDP